MTFTKYWTKRIMFVGLLHFCSVGNLQYESTCLTFKLVTPIKGDKSALSRVFSIPCST